jgi:phosphatidylinositol glycan class B
MKGQRIKRMLEFIERKPFHHLLSYSLVLGLVVCFFSTGFFHPDEHFSIIELMNLKLGNVEMGIFNWDVTLKMRSFLQPFFYFILYKATSGLGLNDPFVFTFLIRFLGFALGVYSLYRLAQTKELISSERGRKITFVLMAFSWYTPFIFARTSSENLSSSFFLLTLSMIFSLSQNKRAWWVGLFWALSFGLRFQMGIAVAGAFFWALWQRKVSLLTFLKMALAFLGGMALLLAVDRWGYGEWVFTPWNYLRENLVHSRVSEFGVSPWYYYFSKGLLKGIPPVGLIYLLSLLLYIWKFPKSLLTWVVVPFILVHSAIGHKEVRFLFFVYLLIPFMFYQLWENFNGAQLQGQRVLPSFFLRLTLFINFVALGWVTLTPAHGPLAVYRWLYQNTGPQPKLYTLYQENNQHLTLSLPFYLKSGTQLIPTSLESFKKRSVSGKDQPLMITSRYEEREKMAQLKHCSIEFSIYPAWALRNNWFRWRDRSSIWTIWKCGRPLEKTLGQFRP